MNKRDEPPAEPRASSSGSSSNAEFAASSSALSSNPHADSAQGDIEMGIRHSAQEIQPEEHEQGAQEPEVVIDSDSNQEHDGDTDLNKKPPEDVDYEHGELMHSVKVIFHPDDSLSLGTVEPAYSIVLERLRDKQALVETLPAARQAASQRLVETLRAARQAPRQAASQRIATVSHIIYTLSEQLLFGCLACGLPILIIGAVLSAVIVPMSGVI